MENMECGQEKLKDIVEKEAEAEQQQPAAVKEEEEQWQWPTAIQEQQQDDDEWYDTVAKIKLVRRKTRKRIQGDRKFK